MGEEDQMSSSRLRTECLDQAIRISGASTSAEAIISKAKQFENYVLTGDK